MGKSYTSGKTEDFVKPAKFDGNVLDPVCKSEWFMTGTPSSDEGHFRYFIVLGFGWAKKVLLPVGRSRLTITLTVSMRLG